MYFEGYIWMILPNDVLSSFGLIVAKLLLLDGSLIIQEAEGKSSFALMMFDMGVSNEIEISLLLLLHRKPL
jgi:hypothetical protein